MIDGFINDRSSARNTRSRLTLSDVEKLIEPEAKPQPAKKPTRSTLADLDILEDIMGEGFENQTGFQSNAKTADQKIDDQINKFLGVKPKPGADAGGFGGLSSRKR